MENEKYIDISLWKILLILIIITAIVGGIIYIKKNNTDNSQDNAVTTEENEQKIENTSTENYNEENDYLKKAEEEAEAIISSEEQDEDMQFFLKEIGFLNAKQDNQYDSSVETSVFNAGIKLDIASNFVYEKKFNQNPNAENQLRFSKEEINTAIKEIFNENITNIIASEASLLKYDELSNSYIYKEAGDENHVVYLIKATSKTNEDGTIKVTFLYAYPSEGDVLDNKLDDYDCYRSVVNVRKNEKYEYSKYQFADKLPLSSRIIGKVKNFK